MLLCMWLRLTLGLLGLHQCFLGLKVHLCTVRVSVRLRVTQPVLDWRLLALGLLRNWSSECTVVLDRASLGLGPPSSRTSWV